MGRFSLMMILGLSAVLMIMGPNMYKFATSGYKNYLDYDARMLSHNIALAGVNIACNTLFMNNNWIAGYNNVSFNGGTFSVKVDSSQIVWTGLYRKRLTSISSYGGLHDTVVVTFQPSNFAQFCVYLQNMSGVSWATGDTVWGPCHIEATMNVTGVPVFYGKTTAKNGTSPATLPSGATNPKFYGGYQSGVSVPMPTSFAKAETSASQFGKVFSYTGAGTYAVNVTFNNDSTITYQEVKNGVKGGNTTVKINTLAPNGTIWVKNGNVNIKTSTVKGRCTIIASGTAANQGCFNINGDIKYASDPSLTGSGTDMLGLCADKDILVHAPDSINFSSSPKILPQHDVIIESALFTRTGKFYTDLYNNSSATGLGMVKVVGSLVSYNIGAFSTPDASGNVKYGYKNLFLFDPRYYNSFPPNYPVTGYYNICAWKE
jgi:hypothetical protein